MQREVIGSLHCGVREVSKHGFSWIFYRFRDTSSLILPGTRLTCKAAISSVPKKSDSFVVCQTSASRDLVENATSLLREEMGAVFSVILLFAIYQKISSKARAVPHVTLETVKQGHFR